MNTILRAAALLSASLLMLCWLTPYIPVQFAPFLSFLSLTVPLLIIANILLLIWAIWRKKRFGLLILFALIGTYVIMGSIYRLGPSDNSVPEGALSVLSFNTRSFYGYQWSNDPSSENEIIEFVKNEDPDILCFQEFSRIFHRNLKIYPYRYETPYNSDKSTQAIFSKYPITGSGSLDFPNSANNALYADILYQGDTIRVYNVHLQSFRVHPSRRLIRKMAVGWIYNRIASTFVQQQNQAELIIKHMASSPYENILCGDFNNTPFSRVYRMVKGKMKDSFKEIGSGFGGTYKIKFLPFRIDMIMADPAFEVLSHRNYSQKFSDHYPLMASFRLKKMDSNSP